MAPVDPEMASALHQEIPESWRGSASQNGTHRGAADETGFRVALFDGGFRQTDMVILAIGVKP